MTAFKWQPYFPSGQPSCRHYFFVHPLHRGLHSIFMTLAETNEVSGPVCFAPRVLGASQSKTSTSALETFGNRSAPDAQAVSLLKCNSSPYQQQHTPCRGRNLSYISEDAPLDVVLRKFVTGNSHIMIAHKPDSSGPIDVVLEGASITGLITLEDVMETLIQVCIAAASTGVLLYHQL